MGRVNRHVSIVRRMKARTFHKCHLWIFVRILRVIKRENESVSLYFPFIMMIPLLIKIIVKIAR